MGFDYKKASKKELKAEYDRIGKEMGDDRFFTKKELDYLPEVMQDGETIHAFSSGMLNNNTWLIVLTDRRIIFLDKGMLFGLRQESVPLNRINAISGSTGLFFGTIVITDGAKDRKITAVWKKTVRIFIDRCQQAIDALDENRQTKIVGDDICTRLERLAQLKEKEIITCEEFEREKAKILAGG